MPYKDKEKQREYQRLWIQKRRDEFFVDKICVSCGSINELQLDHINSSNKISHRIWSWTQERQDKELAKCQVLCRLCHEIKTWDQDGRIRAEHGGATMYDKYGCRCQPCKEYKKEINAKRYTSK